MTAPDAARIHAQGGDLPPVTALDAAALTEHELEPLDGVHHLWCKKCHPEWAVRPLGAELGVPFTAVCGQRAVLLARWQSDDLRIPGVCETCANPATPCATCGSL